MGDRVSTTCSSYCKNITSHLYPQNISYPFKKARPGIVIHSYKGMIESHVLCSLMSWLFIVENSSAFSPLSCLSAHMKHGADLKKLLSLTKIENPLSPSW